MTDNKNTTPPLESQEITETPESIAEPAAIQEAESKPTTKQTSVARSAGIVSIAVMFSRVLGLVREVIFAHFFGGIFV